jgi:hypothetical protein
VVAEIPEKQFPQLRKAGETVWKHYYLLHTPITMTARRYT